MSYTVHFKPSAEREFRKLPEVAQNRIAKTLLALEEDPRPAGAKKLQARMGYRIRVGEYRILYSIANAEKIVEILAIGHRRDIYR